LSRNPPIGSEQYWGTSDHRPFDEPFSLSWIHAAACILFLFSSCGAGAKGHYRRLAVEQTGVLLIDSVTDPLDHFTHTHTHTHKRARRYRCLSTDISQSTGRESAIFEVTWMCWRHVTVVSLQTRSAPARWTDGRQRGNLAALGCQPGHLVMSSAVARRLMAAAALVDAPLK